MTRITRWLAAGAGLASAAYAAYVATTWVRFGRRKPTEGDVDDTLLDAFMPAYDVSEHHQIGIDAPAEVTLAAARELDLDSSRMVRAIFRGRELILRAQPDATPRPKGLIEAMKAIGWGQLADLPGHEIVMGAVTQPWQANPTFRALSPDEFATFAEPGYVKIAWTLRAKRTHEGGSTFFTETRAVATDAASRAKFRVYWSLLSPGILLIRRATLAQLKAHVERRWRVAGDDLLPDATTQLTHAVTIDAPPGEVWPWLVQIGCQRAGWYSWDVLDNAGHRSADHIIPELQHLAVGDVIPARPTGAEGFKVVRIVPERALVLSSMAPGWQGTWAFDLRPLGADRTRLVTRYRAALPPKSPMAMMVPAIAAVHAFMERKQLRTIKHHAEHDHTS